MKDPEITIPTAAAATNDVVRHEGTTMMVVSKLLQE
jgi:hypothetical protein